MARLICKQPNGKYASWSTIVDDFVLLDLTKEEYIETRAKEAYEEKKAELESDFENLQAGWNCINLEDALARIRIDGRSQRFKELREKFRV